METALEPCPPVTQVLHAAADTSEPHCHSPSAMRPVSLAHLNAYCSSNAEMAYSGHDVALPQRVDPRTGTAIPSLSTQRRPQKSAPVHPKANTTTPDRDGVLERVMTPFENLPRAVAGLYKAVFRLDSPENQQATALAVDPIKDLLAASQHPGDSLSAMYDAVRNAGVAGTWKGLIEGIVDPPNHFLRLLADKASSEASLAIAAVAMLESIGPGGRGIHAAKVAATGATKAQQLAARSQSFVGDTGDHLGQGVRRSGLVHLDDADNVVSSQVRFVRTADIRDADLGYDYGGLREPLSSSAVAGLTTAPVKRILNVTLVSDVRNGRRGLVRLGELEDGRPVALKTYYSDYGPKADEAMIRGDTGDVKFDSDLGIGPMFHGTFVDEAGRTNIVMDVVRGDFPAAVPRNIAPQTFIDLEAVLHRLAQADIHDLQDFQPLINDQGRLLVIDPGGSRQIGKKPAHRPDSAEGGYTRARASVLLSADPAVAQQYLAELRRSNPDALEGLRGYYAARQLPFPGS